MTDTALTSATAALSAEDLHRLRSAFVESPELVRMQNAVTRVGIAETALNHARAVGIGTTMSNKLDNWSATNQKRSGRCWLFAALNLLRYGTKQKLGVKEFEFSQNYAMYWDKLERANYFLNDVIATADQPVDDRLFSFMLSELMGDGGQWNMATNLIKKHGLVPKEAMPETQSSGMTAPMNNQLRTWLRQGAKTLRDLVADHADDATLDAARETYVAGAHRILTIHLGTPPESFDWEWRDDKDEFHRDGTITPVEFAERYVTLPIDEYVCLVDDPRAEHPKNTTLTVEHLGNVVGGDPVLYLNSAIDDMKQLAMDAIVNGEPVWFGCDVAKQMQRKDGLWAADLFDFGGVYDTTFSLNKEDRIRYGDSLMTHAMLLVGVDVVDGKPRRWRVENSWGTENADKGFYTMDDSWFDEYVFEVVVNRAALPADLAQGLNTEPTVLPAWDPMGALA